MSEVKAFVGHSFTEDDREIVEKFLRFFSTIAKTNDEFSWEHAEGAEPQRLDEKVMRLMEGKNTFIGICTRKEKVGHKTAFHDRVFWRKQVIVDRRDLFWKTSDWIIQEIGYAKAKGLHLILLIEEGVRDPGGLQGNVEYIPFARAHPEATHARILEMIATIARKIPDDPQKSSDVVPATAAEAEDEVASENLWKEPKPSWNEVHYEFGFMHAVVTEDVEAQKRIDEAYKSSPLNNGPDGNIRWEACKEYTKVFLSRGGEIRRLKDLVKDHPQSVAAVEYLGRAFADRDEYRSAADSFLRAANLEVHDRRKISLLGMAVNNLSKLKESSEAAKVLDEMRNIANSTSSNEVNLLYALLDYAEGQKNDGIAIALLERLVELLPDDNELRFRLAYLHSQKDNHDLALLHYANIPSNARSAMTWNNLGAAFDDLHMPGKAVENYLRSEASGETLAISNISQKLIRAGFHEEAKKRLDVAIMTKDCHKNIPLGLTLINETEETENQKEQTALESAKRKSKYFRRFGKAITEGTPKSIASDWNGPDCLLRVSSEGGNFSATGDYTRPKEGASLSLIGRGLLGSAYIEEPGIEYRVAYKGQWRGRAIEGTISRKKFRDGKAITTALTDALDSTNVLMILTLDGHSIEVMESQPASDPKFYTIDAREL